MARLSVARLHHVTAVITGSALGLALGVTLGVWPASALGQTITVPPGYPLGQGLEDQYTFKLSPKVSSNTSFTVTVADGSICQVSACMSCQGGNSATVQVPAGHTSGSFYAMGLSLGPCGLTVSASGMSPAPGQITIMQPSLQIINLNTSISTQSANDPFNVQAGVPIGTPSGSTNPPLHPQMAIVGSGAGLEVQVCSSVTGVALINGGPCAQACIPQLYSATETNLLIFELPQGLPQAGQTTVSATLTSLLPTPGSGSPPPPPQASVVVTVAQTVMNIIGPNLGNNLEDQYTIQLSAPAGQNTSVHLRVANDSLNNCLLASALNVTSINSYLDLTIPMNSSSVPFYLLNIVDPTAAFDPVPCNLTATVTAPANSGISDAAGTVWMMPGGLEFVSLPFSMLNGTSDDFYVYTGLSGLPFETQEVRYGSDISAVEVTVCSSDCSVASIICPTWMPSICPGQQCCTVPVSSGSYSTGTGNLKVQGNNNGTATISAQAPGFNPLQQDLIVGARNTTVTLPNPLAERLEDVSTINLSAAVTAATTFDVCAENQSIGVCKVATDPVTDVGDTCRQVTVSAGSAQGTFYTLGMVINGTNDLCDVSAVPDPDNRQASPGEGQTVVVDGAFSIVNLPTALATTSLPVSFNVDSGVPGKTANSLSDTQQAQVGGLMVEVCNSDARILTISGGQQSIGSCTASSGCQLVQIQAGQYEAALQAQVTSTTSGGKACVTARTPYCETSSGSYPVFRQGQACVNVAPTVSNITNLTLGGSLEAQTTLTVSKKMSTDTYFTVSVDSGTCQLAANSTDAASDSIYVKVPAGKSSAPFYVLGPTPCQTDATECHLVSEPTPCGTTVGGVTIPCPTPNIVGGDGTVTVVEPGMRISKLSQTQQTQSVDDAFYVEVGPAPKQSITVRQAVRRDFPHLTDPATGRTTTGLPIKVCSSDPSVGGVYRPGDAPTCGGGSPECVTVYILPQQLYTNYDSSTNPVTSDLWFHPCNPGNTIVSAVVPDWVAEQGGPCSKLASLPVTVGQSTITTVCPENAIGAGLQDTCAVKLSISASLTVDICSETPGVCIVAPDEKTPGNTCGSSRCCISVPIKGTSANFAVQALDGQEGNNCEISANPDPPDPSWAAGPLTEYIVPHAFQIRGLATSIPLPAQWDPFQICVGIPDPDKPQNIVLQTVRPQYDANGNITGGLPGPPPLCSSEPQTGEIALKTGSSTWSAPAQCQPVDIEPSSACTASNAFKFAPEALSPPSTDVCVSGPDYQEVPAWDCVEVWVPKANLSFDSTGSIGAGLMDTFVLNAGTTVGDSYTVTVKSLTPTTCLVAVDETANSPGQGYVPVTIGAGKSQTTFTIHGLEQVAGAPGSPGVPCQLTAYDSQYFNDAPTGQYTIVRPALRLNSVKTSFSASSSSDPISVSSGVAAAGSFKTVQKVRTGSPMPPQINVCSNDVNVGDIIPSPDQGPSTYSGTPYCSAVVSGPGQHCRGVSIDAGSNTFPASSGVTLKFEPTGNGATVVSASAPDYDTSAQGSVEVSVSGFTLALNASGTINVGSQQGGFTVSRQVSTPDSIAVTVNSSSSCAVSDSAGTAGGPSAILTIPAGNTQSNSFWILGLTPGTCTLQASTVCYHAVGSGSVAVPTPTPTPGGGGC